MPGSMPGRRRLKAALLETVIASEAQQSIASATEESDRFVACAPRNDDAGIAFRSVARVVDAWSNDLTDNIDSYVCGIADAPLLGDTIGRSLDLAAQRWADREALVSPSHDVRWTWTEFAERVDALAAGFLALGLERGARIGVWSLNRPEWTLTQFAAAKAGLILVTINPAYRLSELEFALAKVGCAAIVTATAFKTSNYMEMLNTLLPELAKSQAGRIARGAAAATARGDPDRRADIARHDRVRGRDAHGRRAAPRAACRTRQDAAVRRCRQYPVHQRHHGLAQGRDADASQHPQQRLFRRPRDAPDRAGPHLHSGAALSLLRHGDGQPRLRHARRHHGLSRRRLRSAGDAANHRAGEMHGALRRADDVHRRTRSSGVCALRPEIAAHRHHGRRALPGRGDEARQQRDEHGRSDDRLWHDRNQAGQLPERDRRSAGAARLHRRAHPSACRGQGRRSRGARGAARRTRRTLHPRLQRHAGLLGRGGKDRRRARRQRLDAHRRHRHHRRRRLLQHRRPHQGHGDPRRRKPLSARDRGIPLSPSQDPGRADLWRRRRPLRRGALRLDPHPAGRDAHRRRGPRLLPRPDRPQQDSRVTSNSSTSFR